MKKLTVAALVALTSTVSMAQVEVSGKIGAYVDNTDKAGTAASTLGQEATNYLAVKAKEDLGGGLSARVIIDTKLYSSDPKSANSQLGDRESTVGLANKFGSVDMGRSYHSAFNTIRFTDSFAGLYGNIAEDVHNFRANRFSNGVFVKANPSENIGLTYDRVLNTTTGPDGLSYSGQLKFGQSSITAARWETGLDKSNVVGAVTSISGYRFNLLSSKDTTAGVQTKGNSVGLQKQLGNSPYTFMTTYGKKTGAAATDLTAYNVGVDYAFSKRTHGQVLYRKVNADNNSLDTKQVALGLIHSF